MKRSEKVRLANEAAAVSKQQDDRDPAAREGARREWAQVRRSAREAYLANGDWQSILKEYRERGGFYTPSERERMCKDYTDELVMNATR